MANCVAVKEVRDLQMEICNNDEHYLLSMIAPGGVRDNLGMKSVKKKQRERNEGEQLCVMIFPLFL